MEEITIRGLNFTYPEQEKPVLRDVNLTVSQGEFLVLCGPSGCGKSTLLRQLKTVLVPHGRRTGEILCHGVPLERLDQREQSGRIGFVQQSPENQLVTDKVWHEMAFGLESLGLDTPTIRKRVAETASFFGIQNWFYKDVSALSGGQKQLLNLASVMVMQPSVLILDEPTSQLDPIAASDFLAALAKINRELGITILLTEHRLEEAFSFCTRAAVMDRGTILCTGTPSEVGVQLRQSGNGMFLTMPAAMRIWAAADSSAHCPVSAADGRRWLEEFARNHDFREVPEKKLPSFPETAIEASGLWFKYEKNLPDVVKGLDLTLGKGEFLAILGGNGTGKTTALRLLSGLQTPYRGDIRQNGTVGVLPQNPQTLFVKKTVREDLYEIFRDKKLTKEEQDGRAAHVTALCGLNGLLDRHPYDLSGGEQQRAALAKVLLLNPDILLMDEPTKGLDAEFKQTFAAILRMLLQRGVSILMVSHDIEFCASHAHRCSLFFDGSIVAEGSPRAFFSGSSFYTTTANRISRGILPDAVTAEDVIAACGGTVPPDAELPSDIPPMPEPKPETADWKPPKLPLWRRLIATVSGTGALIFLIHFLRGTDLTVLSGAEGLTGAAPTGAQFGQYGIFLTLFFIFALCVNRKTVPQTVLPTPKEKRSLTKRTRTAAILILLLIPLTLFAGAFFLGGRKYYFIALLILLETMTPFFLIFEGRKPQARELVVIAALCALGVAGRAFFFMLPQFKPVMAVTIITGAALGGETGFLVGSVTMLASNMLFSQGPWTPWQMFAMGIIGFLAGVLFRKGLLRRTRISLSGFGALAAILIYGGIMNPASALIWAGELNGKILLSYYLSGFPMDCVHAAATWLFLWFAAEPMLAKLERIKTKYGLME